MKPLRGSEPPKPMPKGRRDWHGKKYVEAAVSEADRTAAGLIKEAEEKALSIAEEKIREAERETASLMKTAQSRIDRASAVIVEGIVGGI